MVQFISRNPVTATMQANEAVNQRAEQAALQMQNARDEQAFRQEQRDQSRAQDALGGKLATIFSDEPPTPVPDNLGGGPPAPSPIRSFGDKTREAVQVAAATPGGGKMAMQLAQDAQKRSDAAHAEAIKAFGQGDFELAQNLNSRHGLGLDGVFTNPSALQTSRALAKSIEHLKLEPAQSVAYMDAASKKFAETRDMAAAGAAGLQAARSAPQKIKHFATDDTGKVTGITEYGEAVPTAVRGRTTRAGGAGGSLDKTKGAKFDKDADGNRIILYRDRSFGYPKDAQGNDVKIPVGTDMDQKFVRDLTKTFAGKALIPPEDPVAAARDMAAATAGRGGAPSAAPANALPAGIPPGSKQVGTAGGKPVFQDASGKRYIVE